jgi:hypothetical protein
MDLKTLLQFKQIEKPTTQEWALFDRKWQQAKGQAIIQPLSLRFINGCIAFCQECSLSLIKKPLLIAAIALTFLTYFSQSPVRQSHLIIPNDQTFVYDVISCDALNYSQNDLHFNGIESKLGRGNYLDYHASNPTWVTAFNF